LSANAGVVMDHLDGHTAEAAAGVLAAAYPDVERATIDQDVIRTIRWLLQRAVIEPAVVAAPASLAAEPALA
jgi:hypothetical protein